MRLRRLLFRFGRFLEKNGSKGELVILARFLLIVDGGQVCEEESELRAPCSEKGWALMLAPVLVVGDAHALGLAHTGHVGEDDLVAFF